VTDGDGLPPTSAWRLLAQGTFGRYFAGNLASNIGNWFQDIASAILIFQLTGSAVMVAGVAIAGHGTSIVLSPLGGQLADRFDRRWLLFFVHIAQGIAAAVLALLVTIGQATAWTVFAFSLVIGAGRAINNPTLHALLPALVAPKDLAQGAALQSVTFNLARAVGPVLGALVVAGGGAGAAFWVNSATFFVFVAILPTLRLRVRPPITHGTPAGTLNGLRYVRDRPRLVLLLVISTIIGMSTDPVLTLGPAFAERYDQGQAWAGWFVTAFGMGAILMAPFAGVLRRRIGRVRGATASLVVITAGFVVIGAVPYPAAALAGALVAGVAFMFGSNDLTTALQELTDDEVRGRVMALWSVGFLGSRPIAALLDGTVSDLVSPGAAVLVLAAVMLGAAVLSAVWSGRLGGPPAFAPSISNS
jgi:predicted MFS family arabinose efflux permease